MENLEEGYKRNYFDLYEALKKDTDYWWVELRKDFDKQLFRRAAVKSTFSFTEGIIYALKQLVLWWQDQSVKDHPLLGIYINDQVRTEREFVKAYLSERIYEIDDKGNLREQSARIDHRKNLLFAFNEFAKEFNPTYKLDKSGKDWENYFFSLRVRDRLTHPKHVIDLEVTDEEILAVNAAYVWFAHEVLKLWGYKK